MMSTPSLQTLDKAEHEASWTFLLSSIMSFKTAVKYPFMTSGFPCDCSTIQDVNLETGERLGE